MLQSDWQKLSPEVKDFVWFQMPALNEQIFKKYGISAEQAFVIQGLEEEIITKRSYILDLPAALEKIEGTQTIDKRGLILDLAYQIFWPLAGYLEYVDRLILRLGGKVPSQKIFLGQNLTQKNIFPGEESGTVKLLVNKYEDFRNLLLTSHKITTRDGRQVAPTIANWLQDYINFLGAGLHTSLQRAQYLAKESNVLSLAAADKDKIRHLTLSYDEGRVFDFILNNGILDIKEAKAAGPTEQNFDKILAKLQDKVTAFQSKLISSDLILSEIKGDTSQLANVLWDALGVPDQEKSISILQILLERQILFRILTEDNRFKNIFKRFIELKYGHSFADWPEKNQDKLMTVRLFLEMILADKLKMNQEQAALAALYLSNQVVYFDKSDNQLKWREVKTVGSNLAWAYPIL